MEPNKSGTDRNTRITYSENSVSSRDGPSTGNGSHWLESSKDSRRDHGKKREHSRDLDRSRDRSFHGKAGMSWRENRERFNEEPPQQLSQQPNSYPYPINTGQSFMDNNRHAVSMPSYNLITLNSQWGGNPMDGMAMPGNVPVNPCPSSVPGASGMEISQNTTPTMTPYAYMGMPGGNMFGMMGNFSQFGVNNQENMVGPVSGVIQLTKCVLYPPNPKVTPPIFQNKPLGCKTVFVRGLPEKATEEIVKEVFERCGCILKIRMSKKKCCHIRFADESFVENALYFSGYEMRIENRNELPYTGTLHVDYALARDDQIECQQVSDLEANCLQLEEAYFKAPSPPIVHYSEEEAALLKEKLQDEGTFQQSLAVLISWLEKGECNKRNVNNFYSMIQSTNSHVRRLMNEKLKYEDELNKAKSMLMNQIKTTLTQFKDIEKVFSTASLQKVWDHFTKAQRRNIELWKKQTEETKHAHLAELLNERIEDEMELSEDEVEEKESMTMRTSDISEQQKNKLKEELNKLKEANDELRCQLEAAENEKMVVKSDLARDLEIKERQLHYWEQAFETFSKKLLNDKQPIHSSEVHALKSGRNTKADENNEDSDTVNVVDSSSSVSSVGENKALLICLVSVFLHVHPMGASIDYICSYLHQYDRTIELRDIENLMKNYPSVFREDSTGIGASFCKTWTFIGFQS